MGDNQGRRGQIRRPDIRVDAAFEVAVARQHGGGHQLVGLDRVGQGLGDGAGHAIARGAAETHDMEAKGVERLLKAGLFEYGRDDLTAGRQRGLDPRLDLQPFRHGIAGQQTRRDHVEGIGRVRAARDRRDDDGAVRQFELRTLDRYLPVRDRPAAQLFMMLAEGGRDRIEIDTIFRVPRSRDGRPDASQISVTIWSKSGASVVSSRQSPCALA